MSMKAQKSSQHYTIVFLINHFTLSLCANHETGSIYYKCIPYLPLFKAKEQLHEITMVSVCVCVRVLADLHEI